ncbi:MAG: class I SAM-dependent methyltransferase [Pyrinomonadaceae bacterium]
MLETVEKFVAAIAASLTDDRFVKATLGNYKGDDKHLQKLNIRRLTTRKGARLCFLYRTDTRDTVKNYPVGEGTKLIATLLGTEFFSGHLFTTENDYQLDIGKKGKSRLNIAKPTFKIAPPSTHDRKKKLQIDPNAFYLKALGIATDDGRIRDRQQDKWRQINKFVETLAKLFDKSQLADRQNLKIVDMGSGKGYLTFATYDYFTNVRGLNVTMTGVEAKSELAGLCNGIAQTCEFEGLKFVNGTIETHDTDDVDILIALHACDTATDDAVYKGIAAKADLIVAAPCCHREVRPQIKAPAMFHDFLKHGVVLERTAETVTDGLRALLLERSGYASRLFEFISVEHTPKNNMLVGTRHAQPILPKRRDEIDLQIAEIKSLYSIHEQRLEKLLTQKSKATDGHG